MTTKSKFKSAIREGIHASASALHKVGALDKATMRHFDESCLVVPSEIKPGQIKQLREKNLNTSESTVKQWETGAKKPSGMALKLLAIVQKHGLQVLN